MADHCFEALTNKEQWESLAAENKTIADKIKDFIKEFVAMINRAFDKYFGTRIRIGQGIGNGRS